MVRWYWIVAVAVAVYLYTLREAALAQDKLAAQSFTKGPAVQDSLINLGALLAPGAATAPTGCNRTDGKIGCYVSY